MMAAGKRVRLGRWCLAAFVVALGLGVSAPARADNIDQKLIEEAPKIMKHLRENKYKNVGVLKFRVQKGDKGTPSYSAGELNSNMAIRLENALILLDDPKNPIGIIHDASRTAASRKLSSRDAKGRRGMLEESKFHLAWGKETVKADAFLTGDVKISTDNKTATVSIKVFDAKTENPKEICHFSTKTDHNILSEAGQSWRLSRAVRSKRDFDGDKADDAAADNATTQDQGKEQQPAQGDEPVKLHVIFDGNEVPLDSDPANPGERRARMIPKKRGPTTTKEISGPTQSVEFRIENTGKDPCAVVLKVNGQNTLFLQEEEAEKCTKWVLGPGEKYTIKGFYTEESGKNLNPFKVLSEEESKKLEDEWKDNDKLGLIDFHVFQTGGGGMNITRKPSLRGLSKRDLTKNKPASMADLQRALADKTHAHNVNGKLEVNKKSLTTVRHTGKPRTLIGKGESNPTEAGGDLSKVDFDNATEIYHYSIRYYTPGGGSASPKN